MNLRTCRTLRRQLALIAGLMTLALGIATAVQVIGRINESRLPKLDAAARRALPYTAMAMDGYEVPAEYFALERLGNSRQGRIDVERWDSSETKRWKDEQNRRAELANSLRAEEYMRESNRLRAKYGDWMATQFKLGPVKPEPDALPKLGSYLVFALSGALLSFLFLACVPSRKVRGQNVAGQRTIYV